MLVMGIREASKNERHREIVMAQAGMGINDLAVHLYIHKTPAY